MNSPSRVPFTKMEGCGNDYVYVDAIASAFPFARAHELARSWSDRHFGIGSDGLIVLDRDDAGTLRMAMWNADGSRGAMCGNGLRCLARFAADRGHVAESTFVVATDSGPREVALLAGDDVRVEIGEARSDGQRTIEVAGESLAFVTGSAGNPHAVTFVDDVETAPVERVGKALQTHEAFPDGVNVEFVQVLGDDRIRQRTFERGSGETLACGTGATFAVVASRLTGNIRGDRAKVELRGGTLTVVGSGPSLAIEGPARTVFRGEIDLPTA